MGGLERRASSTASIPFLPGTNVVVLGLDDILVHGIQAGQKSAQTSNAVALANAQNTGVDVRCAVLRGWRVGTKQERR